MHHANIASELFFAHASKHTCTVAQLSNYFSVSKVETILEFDYCSIQDYWII